MADWLDEAARRRMLQRMGAQRAAQVVAVSLAVGGLTAVLFAVLPGAQAEVAVRPAEVEVDDPDTGHAPGRVEREAPRAAAKPEVIHTSKLILRIVGVDGQIQVFEDEIPLHELDQATSAGVVGGVLATTPAIDVELAVGSAAPELEPVSITVPRRSPYTAVSLCGGEREVPFVDGRADLEVDGSCTVTLLGGTPTRVRVSGGTDYRCKGEGAAMHCRAQ